MRYRLASLPTCVPRAVYGFQERLYKSRHHFICTWIHRCECTPDKIRRLSSNKAKHLIPGFVKKKKIRRAKTANLHLPPHPPSTMLGCSVGAHLAARTDFFFAAPERSPLANIGHRGKGGKCMDRQRYTRADFFFANPGPKIWRDLAKLPAH